jgi:hypothetical protein
VQRILKRERDELLRQKDALFGDLQRRSRIASSRARTAPHRSQYKLVEG